MAGDVYQYTRPGLCDLRDVLWRHNEAEFEMQLAARIKRLCGCTWRQFWIGIRECLVDSYSGNRLTEDSGSGGGWFAGSWSAGIWCLGGQSGSSQSGGSQSGRGRSGGSRYGGSLDRCRDSIHRFTSTFLLLGIYIIGYNNLYQEMRGERLAGHGRHLILGWCCTRSVQFFAHVLLSVCSTQWVPYSVLTLHLSMKRWSGTIQHQVIRWW